LLVIQTSATCRRAGRRYRDNEMPCDCARESAAIAKIDSWGRFQFLIRDKSGFLEAFFRKSDAMIVINNIAYHSVLRCIL
jgi:hypothetical protein